MTAVFFHPEADAELIAAAVYYEGQQEELGKRSGPSFILSTWKPGPIFPLAPYSPGPIFPRKIGETHEI